MTIVGRHDFVKVPTSAEFKSLLQVMWIDAPESTTNSRSSGLRFDGAGMAPIFRKWEECCFVILLKILRYVWPAYTLLHGHIALATLSPPETDPQILERWGNADEVQLGKSFQAKDFGLECLRDVQQLSWFSHVWIGFRMSVHFRRIDFGGVMSWNTQPNCRASDDWRLDEFCPNFLSLLFPSFPGRSWHSSVTGSLSCQLSFFNIATALLSSFFLDLLVGCSSTWRCANEALFPQTDNHSWSCENKHSEGCHFSQNELLQVPLEVILAGPSRHSTTWASASGTSGSRCISHTLPRRRYRRK